MKLPINVCGDKDRSGSNADLPFSESSLIDNIP